MQIVAAIMLALATATTVVAINNTDNYTDNFTGFLPITFSEFKYHTVEVYAPTEIKIEGTTLWVELDNHTIIENSTIAIYWNNTNQTVLANPNYTLNLPVGNHTVLVEYEEQNYFLKSLEEFNVTVKQAPQEEIIIEDITPDIPIILPSPVLETTIILPEKPTRGHPFEIKLTILNQGLVPVQGVGVSWTTDLNHSESDTCTTLLPQDTCVSTLLVNTTQLDAPGVHKFDVIISVEAPHFALGNNYSVSLWMDTLSSFNSDNQNITIQLTLDNGTGLADQNIKLLDSSLEYTRQTNMEGVAVFPLIAAGTINYSGNDSIFTNPSEISFSLTLEEPLKQVITPQIANNPPEFIDVIDNVVFFENDTFVLNFSNTIVDKDGDPLTYRLIVDDPTVQGLRYEFVGDTLVFESDWNTDFRISGFLNASDGESWTVSKDFLIIVEMQEIFLPSGSLVTWSFPQNLNFNERVNFSVKFRANDIANPSSVEKTALPVEEGFWDPETKIFTYQILPRTCGDVWMDFQVGYTSSENGRAYWEKIYPTTFVNCDLDLMEKTEPYVRTMQDRALVSYLKEEMSQPVAGEPVKHKRILSFNGVFLEDDVVIEFDPRLPAHTTALTKFPGPHIMEIRNQQSKLLNDVPRIRGQSVDVFEGIRPIVEGQTGQFSGKVTMQITKDMKERFEIEYETQAPIVEEVITQNNGNWRKIIRVKSDMHYEDVLIDTDIPQDKILNVNLQSNKFKFGSDELPSFKANLGGKVLQINVAETPSGLKTTGLVANQQAFENIPQTSFAVQKPNTDFKVKLENGKFRWQSDLSDKVFFIDEEPISNIKAYLKDPRGKILEGFVSIVQTGNDFDFSITKPKNFRGGEYTLVIDAGVQKEEITFEWGLVTINTKKSIYRPREIVDGYIVVLDKFGSPVNDADINLTVTGPGLFTEKSTSSSTITRVGEGIYYTTWQVFSEGTHFMNVSASGLFTDHRFSSNLLVDKNPEFDILRSAPLSIYPREGPFSSKIGVFSRDKTSFDLVEYLPKDFIIFSSGGATITETQDSYELTWNNIENGSVVEYWFNTPEVWPYLYEMRAKADDFLETRPWYLAVDPPAYWFNYTWQYRLKFNVSENSGLNQNYYQIQLGPLDTEELITNNSMQSDCGDIRFTNETGSELAHYVIPPYLGFKDLAIQNIGGCDNDDTKIWVQLDNLPADSNTTFYLYYAPLITVNDTEDIDAVFSYPSEQPIYYPIGTVNAGLAG
ncbi:MAG: DUF2341 domain-containing protein, partial [Candidatus Altiarchaeota archaeon]|nr:DUF2341 domain-containing protein [Candidatus Altiarchaeota archaeon]